MKPKTKTRGPDWRTTPSRKKKLKKFAHKHGFTVTEVIERGIDLFIDLYEAEEAANEEAKRDQIEAAKRLYDDVEVLP